MITSGRISLLRQNGEELTAAMQSALRPIFSTVRAASAYTELPNDRNAVAEHGMRTRAFSTMFPDELFAGLAVGVESYTEVAKFFMQNGKLQICMAVITFPEYDPLLLE